MKVDNNHDNLAPKEHEAPIAYAERLGCNYASSRTSKHKKENGQFFTSAELAQFMASFSVVGKEKVRILDPGAGVGILAIALVESLVARYPSLKTIELVLFETDLNVLPLAERSLEHLRVWLTKKNINITTFLCKNDFILHNSDALSECSRCGFYDIIISNPPYFKLSKTDSRAVVLKSVIHGQPNIYSLFLLIAAKLLGPNGHLVFITPRSFCSGSYFRLFRGLFFSLINLNEIHLFRSRNSTFKKDKVLQENVIIKASRNTSDDSENPKIIVSTSNGLKDLHDRSIKAHNLKDLIDLASHQKILHLPTSEIDEIIMHLFKRWSGSLRSYDLEISTGPVVDFRSKNLIRSKRTEHVVPLLGLKNVDCMVVNWPIGKNERNKRAQYIINQSNSASRLVKNTNYVLLRRFSTKEDPRRLIAAPYLKKNFSHFPTVGIENHLNYIYHRKKTLTVYQTVGLAAIFNSKLFDLYFRTFNGNINVSATELRDLPLPDFNSIKDIGSQIIKSRTILNNSELDEIVLNVLNLKGDDSKLY